MKRNFLILAAVAAIGACSNADATPGATVEAFSRRLDNGACVGLREYIASNMREAFGENIELLCTRGIEERRKIPNSEGDRLKQVTILDTQEEGDRAIVRAEFEEQSGRKQSQPFVLVREENRWRIDLLNTMQLNRAGPGGPPGPGGAPMPPPGAPAMGPGAPGAPEAPPPAPMPQPAPAENK